jgi:hypothetical protein
MVPCLVGTKDIFFIMQSSHWHCFKYSIPIVRNARKVRERGEEERVMQGKRE